MGKLKDVFSKGLSESERKELQSALQNLSRLNAELTAKYTLANNLEHITDGRTAAAKLIRAEIEQLQTEIADVKAQKNQLILEFQELQQLKNEVSSLKSLMEHTYDNGTTTTQTLKELLDSENLAALYNESDKLKIEFRKYFIANEGDELSHSQKLDHLSTKAKDLHSYLFNNEVTVEGIVTSREQAIKKKYQEIDEYYDHLFTDETNESGEKISSFSTIFSKQKANLDKFYLKIFGDDKTPSLEKDFQKRLENLSEIEKEARKVLNDASNAGLAGGFHDKGNQAKDNKKNNLYVFIGALVTLAGFNLFTIDFNKLDEITITSLTVRLILNIPLIWIATVANLNLNRYSKLEQEYGHKEALARSFEKYKAEIKNLNTDSEESIYLQAKLLDINLEAFRKNPADGMETVKSDSILEKLIPNIERSKKTPEES